MLRGRLRDGRTLDTGGLLVGLPEGSILAGDGEVWAFGVWHEQDGRVFLAEPDDPLAELTVVAGDPRVTASRCSSLARRYLAASAFLIGLAVAINLLLALFLAARIVG